MTYKRSQFDEDVQELIKEGCIKVRYDKDNPHDPKLYVTEKAKQRGRRKRK